MDTLILQSGKQISNSIELEYPFLYIYKIDIPNFARNYQMFLETFSLDEKEKAGRFYFDESKYQFVIMRGLLKYLLSGYSKIPIGDIQFDYSQYGKPLLCNKGVTLYFNISHTNSCGLIAISNHVQIGIDIEFIDNRNNKTLLDIANRFFHPAEYESLLKLPEFAMKRGFYKIWTSKEALSKVLGLGLSLSLTASVIPPDLYKNHVFTIENCVDLEGCQLTNFWVGHKYSAALAIKGEGNIMPIFVDDTILLNDKFFHES